MDSSAGTSSSSMDSTGSFGIASPASVDSSHLLTKDVKVIDAKKLKEGGSLGSQMGKRVTYAINPQSREIKSESNFRPHLTIDIPHSNRDEDDNTAKSNNNTTSNNSNNNNNLKRRIEIETPTNISAPPTPTAAFAAALTSTTPESTKTEETDTEDTPNTTTEEEPQTEEVEDIHIKDERELRITRLPVSPYRSPQRKPRSGTDADPPLNAATDLVQRLLNRSASDATGLLMTRNRAFSDADATQGSVHESDSEDSANEASIAEPDAADTETESKLRVARQRAFSDADMFADQSMLIHTETSTYSSMGSGSSNSLNNSLNRSTKLLNMSGSVGRKGSRSGSIPEKEGDEVVERRGSLSEGSFLRQSLDSSFGELGAGVCSPSPFPFYF